MIQQPYRLEIRRENFGFNRTISVDDIIRTSCVYNMRKVHIDADKIVNGEILDNDERLLVYKNDYPWDEEYCYIKTKTEIMGDGHAKLVTIKKIIIDEHLIDEVLFTEIFTILLQQEDNEYQNRIKIGNKEPIPFHGDCLKTSAHSIARYVCELFHEFTSNEVKQYIMM